MGAEFEELRPRESTDEALSGVDRRVPEEELYPNLEAEWVAKAILLGVEIKMNYTGSRVSRFYIDCRTKGDLLARVYGSSKRRAVLKLLKYIKIGKVHL